MGVKQVIKAMNLAEVFSALKDCSGKVQVIAGGTDLSVQIREGHCDSECLIDISDVEEMRGIAISEDSITLGAAVRFSEVVASEEMKAMVPGLWDACRSVGAPQIRNMGTIGGNIANGSPAADSIPPLLALDADVTLKSDNGERTLKLKDLYLGKGKVDIKEDEVLVTIAFARPTSAKSIVQFEKLGLRNALAISRLSTAVYLELDDAGVIKTARVASGSLGLYPMREPALEDFLVNKTMSQDLIKEGANVYSGIVAERLAGRSTCEFKKEAVKGVFKNAMSRMA